MAIAPGHSELAYKDDPISGAVGKAKRKAVVAVYMCAACGVHHEAKKVGASRATLDVVLIVDHRVKFVALCMVV